MVARDLDTARATLTQAGYETQIIEKTLILKQAHAIEAPERVATLLVQAGHPPTRIAVERDDLEEHFLRLIGEQG
ncbi:hypothetical protein ACFLXI_00505 [Chloroflexota bacterium]